MANMNLLTGRSILIVEDEPLIAWHLAELMSDGGAKALSARTCKRAVELAETENLSAAVLDYGCGDAAQTRMLCMKLAKRQVPYMFYTGCNELDEPHRPILLVRKPANSFVLLGAVTQLLLTSRILPRPTHTHNVRQGAVAEV